MGRKKKEVSIEAVTNCDPALEGADQTVIQAATEEVPMPTEVFVAPKLPPVDPFVAINKSFYDALELLRVEKEQHPESKVLIANAWAYITKAMRAIDLVRKLENK
jgi:hypothetical protein